MKASTLDRFIISTVCDGDMVMPDAEYFRREYTLDEMETLYNMTIRRLEEVVYE